jgi:site-specific DNA recombinase
MSGPCRHGESSVYTRRMMWLGYHRISYIGKRADTPVSEAEYREKVERFAERNGLEVELLPVERDQTGSKLKRPILEAAIKRVERGAAAGLIVVRYNRLSRATASDTHLIIDRIAAASGRVESVEEQFPDTPEGRMARDMSFSVSRMEWERSAAQTHASKLRAVEQGIWPFTSPGPPGYTVTRRRDGGDGKLRRGDPREVARVRAAFKAKAAGGTLREFAERLGVGMSQAQKLLRNRAYLGEIRLAIDGEEHVKLGAHQALIDRATWEAAQVKGPRIRNGGPPALLTGLARCAHCGGAMSPSRDGYGTPNYRCQGRPMANGKRCTRPSIIARAKLDHHVEEVVLPHVASVQAAASTRRTGDLERLEHALEAAEEEIGDYLADRELRDAVGRDRHLAGARERREKIDGLTGELVKARAAVPEVPELGNLGALYRSWPVEKRAHLLRGALSGVVVAKGRGPCAERVRVFAAGFEPGDPEGQLRLLGAE